MSFALSASVFRVLSLPQALVFNSEESAGVSEEIQGIKKKSLSYYSSSFSAKAQICTYAKSTTRHLTFMCFLSAALSGPAHSCGGGLASLHSQAQR